MKERIQVNNTPNAIPMPSIGSGEKKYPEIDYCIVILDGAQPFMELHFESLMKTESLDSFASVHIVDKLTSDGTVAYCKEKYPPIHVHSLGFYEPRNRLGEPITSSWQWDMAYSYEYATQSCGTAPWICMIHPDVVFWNAKEYFEGLNNLITPEVGMIHEGCMSLHRREAHYRSSIKFWPLFGAVLGIRKNEPDHPGWLLHRNDERTKDKNIFQVFGIEMWELLCIEIQNLGWSSIMVPYEIVSLKEHIVQSTKHNFDPNNPGHVEHWKQKMARLQHRLSRLREGYNNYM